MTVAQRGEAERLLPFLYSLDARAASERLLSLGAAAVEPLIRVLSGQYPLPDLAKVEATEIDGVLLVCFGAAALPDAAAGRERAAYLLGEIADERAVAPLAAAYGRETERHAKLAMARALGMIGHQDAVEVLVAALETPAWTPHYRLLVDDLARLGGERAIEPLIRLAQRPAYSYGSAARAAQALLAYRDDSRVLDGLTGALRLDAEFATLEAVTGALVEIGDRRGAQGLLRLVEQMLALPAECWDAREENLSETDQGEIFHVLKTEFRSAVSAIRKIGDAETSAALERALAAAPGDVPEH